MLVSNILQLIAPTDLIRYQKNPDQYFNFRLPFDLSTGADSLCYLSVDGLKRAVQYNMKSKNRAQSGHCTACLTGEYPGGLPEELSW